MRRYQSINVIYSLENVFTIRERRQLSGVYLQWVVLFVGQWCFVCVSVRASSTRGIFQPDVSRDRIIIIIFFLDNLLFYIFEIRIMRTDKYKNRK